MEYIIGYYTLLIQEYIIHRIEHTRYLTFHKLHHHLTYDKNDITKVIKKYTLYQNLDLYFYGNIMILLLNNIIFENNIILFQIFILYLQYYFHSEYHKKNSILKNLFILKYLKEKHRLNHKYSNKNYFLLDPTIDIICNSFI